MTEVILVPIYETEFLGFSYGFRAGRGPHHALDAVTVGIDQRRVNWIVNADIRGFLETSSYCTPQLMRIVRTGPAGGEPEVAGAEGMKPPGRSGGRGRPADQHAKNCHGRLPGFALGIVFGKAGNVGLVFSQVLGEFQDRNGQGDDDNQCQDHSPVALRKLFR